MSETGSVTTSTGDGTSAVSDGETLCRWCQINPVRPGQTYCARKCRQAAFRLRKKKRCWGPNAKPGSFDYADPPYIGMAARYYQEQPDFGGEVDHAALVGRLVASFRGGETLGFAISLSAQWVSLRTLINLVPEDLAPRLCPWVKPHEVPPKTLGAHNVWEGVIIVGGRALSPGIADALVAMPARGGGDLPGRKPIAFAAWLSDLLGMLPGDELRDLYPGSGAIGRAWRELSPRTSTTLDEKTRHLVRARILPSVERGAAPPPKRARGVQLGLLESVEEGK